MELRGQLHDPKALAFGKNCRYSLAKWAPEWAMEERIILH
jgi:hypothetical protein